MYKNVNYPGGKLRYWIRGRVIALLTIAEGLVNLFGYWPRWTMNYMIWMDYHRNPEAYSKLKLRRKS